jgi:hypothetical protein
MIFSFDVIMIRYFAFSPNAKMPTKLALQDNGNGLVDVTQNDGIYSAIFPYVGQVTGFYSLQIIADDDGGHALLPKDKETFWNGENSTIIICFEIIYVCTLGL